MLIFALPCVHARSYCRSQCTSLKPYLRSSITPINQHRMASNKGSILRRQKHRSTSDLLWLSQTWSKRLSSADFFDPSLDQFGRGIWVLKRAHQGRLNESGGKGIGMAVSVIDLVFYCFNGDNIMRGKRGRDNAHSITAIFKSQCPSLWVQDWQCQCSIISKLVGIINAPGWPRLPLRSYIHCLQQNPRNRGWRRRLSPNRDLRWGEVVGRAFVRLHILSMMLALSDISIQGNGGRKEKTYYSLAKHPSNWHWLTGQMPPRGLRECGR